MAGNRLVIFVKAPRPGWVKTRLAKVLGKKGACQAYQTMVARLLSHLHGLRRITLRYAPDDAEAEIRPWLRPGWQSQAQGTGTLGERLTRAFAEAFAQGDRRVVLIGSDCPDVQEKDIEMAWRVLRDCDVVLGPALDGGYWLVGLNRPRPELFEGISWSSSDVMAQTLGRIQQQGLAHGLLRLLSDIDLPEEWQAYCRSQGPTLAAGSGSAPGTS